MIHHNAQLLALAVADGGPAAVVLGPGSDLMIPIVQRRLGLSTMSAELTVEVLDSVIDPGGHADDDVLDPVLAVLRMVQVQADDWSAGARTAAILLPLAVHVLLPVD